MTEIAVLGRTGFVGRAVVSAAKRRGHSVRSVSLPRVLGDPAPLSAAVAAWSSQDRARWSSLVSSLSGADAVINAAGLADPDSDDTAALWSANTLLPSIIAQAAAEAAVPRFVHISSAAVQGGRPTLDESTELSPESPYARSKADAERALLDRAIAVPQSVVIYRPTSVMGAGRPTTRRMLSIFGRAVPTTNATAPLPLALVDNVGDAAVHLAIAGGEAPRIVTHPSESMTVGALAEAAGGRLVRVPTWAAIGGLRLLRWSERFRPGVAGLRRRIELVLHGQAVNASALKELGWSPVTTKDAYRSLADHSLAGRPLRLAYLLTRSDTIAGVQVHVRDLAEAMTLAGHEVRVFVGGAGPLVDQLHARGVQSVTLDRLKRELGPRDLPAFLEIRHALKEFQPDLLSCHSSKAGILGRLAGRTLGIPTVFTAHGWAFADGVPKRQRTLYAGIERAMAPLAARLISVSNKDRELAQRLRVGRPDQHLTIHNAVHDVAPEHIANPGAESPVIVSVARLDRQKDHALLFRALAQLDTAPKVLLVGDGPLGDELQSLADSAGLADSVEFLGLRHDIPELLAGAQIYALVSHWEGLPRSIIEALRAGLPVIASDVGGVSELVRPQENGVLVTQGDVAGLVHALEDLLSSSTRRRAMGSASRDLYLQGFTFPRVFAETAAVYGDILGLDVCQQQPL